MTRTPKIATLPLAVRARNAAEFVRRVKSEYIMDRRSAQKLRDCDNTLADLAAIEEALRRPK